MPGPFQLRAARVEPALPPGARAEFIGVCAIYLLFLENEFVCLQWEVAAGGQKADPRGGLTNPWLVSPHSGSLVLPALLSWGCCGRASLQCEAARSLCPCWGRNPPPPYPYPAHHPSFSSQLPALELQQMCQAPALPLSLFSSFFVHIWRNPMGFAGGTPWPAPGPLSQQF